MVDVKKMDKMSEEALKVVKENLKVNTHKFKHRDGKTQLFVVLMHGDRRYQFFAPETSANEDIIYYIGYRTTVYRELEKKTLDCFMEKYDYPLSVSRRFFFLAKDLCEFIPDYVLDALQLYCKLNVVGS